MARVLVTGAAGFLGRQVALALADEGWDVVAHGRTPGSVSELGARGLETIGWDLREAPGAGVRSLGRLEAVVHCAGLSSNWGPRRAFAEANVAGTRRLVEVLDDWGAPHLVHISSASVCFALRDRIGVDEAAPLPRPINDYAWSKRVAEEVVLGQRAAPATVIRPRGIYGAGDSALLPRLVRAARKGPLPLMRGGHAVIDLTHVDDAVDAVRAVLGAREAARGRVYHVSGGEAVTVRSIIEQAAARAGVAVRWRPTPWPLARAALAATEAWHRAVMPAREPVATVYSAGLLAFSQTLDMGRIAREVGWRPRVSFAQGLARTFGETA